MGFGWKGMSPELYNQRTRYGDLFEVVDLIERKSGCDSSFILKYLSHYVELLRSERQREIFKLYYFNKMSIIDIRYGTGIEYSRIERHIKSATDNLIKAFKKEREKK